ncbi:SAV2148 family HEPN domain-containing protein [Streptomyces sp. NBC_01387]|uniref:SAV2148 family HEPN domain-containing protein n=1 Tax=unclassified Streptomyces TaxID=2593676 RepID=UPI0020256C18|nr:MULTISPECIES: SAV2148 family HEPN domain-containing protein [unclassified Streptomyces]MCX4547402.1 SAV2148 family HEPN domain-containing protein [Streptomyces sp. NBC_01500]WSC19125.1 SAV2148 family HEPN domain-containing protein [Streptomyces sp. NBC_01766]WSV53149.1 SAV2148 family HEPN domain-containing protein [Streptomyces sp. NBC_01014]
MGSGGLELPPGDPGHDGGSTGVSPGAVSLARPMEIGAELDWGADAWNEVRTRAQRAGRAYIWLNLVEQRLRAVVAAVLRPIYEPVHGDDWVVAAAGPAGQEWVQRAVAVREVSRRKGYLLDPADDNVLSFLTLPQLRELMVQHWPCFEPYYDDRRDVELALDELEVTRNVVSRNRALSQAVLAQAERASSRLLDILGAGSGAPTADRLPVDAVEDLVGDRYADVVSVHPDRVRLQRQIPAEDLFGGARRLDAIGIGLNLLVQNFSGRRLIRLAESGCRVRLLFLNPASSAVKRRERELGLKKGELSRSVEMNILHMRRVRSRLRDPGAFEIHVFDETPRFMACLVDGDGSDGLAVVQSYLRKARGMEAPVLVLRGGGRAVVRHGQDAEHGLFETYRDEFESVWADSRPVS